MTWEPSFSPSVKHKEKQYLYDSVAGTGEPIYVHQDEKTEEKKYVLVVQGLGARRASSPVLNDLDEFPDRTR